VFVATGASVFHGAQVGKGAIIRVDGIVHLKTRLEPGAVVPIKWIALGDPAQLFPPEKHEELSVVLRDLNFSMTVYGLDPATPERMKEVTRRLSAALAAHRDDRVVQ
jgi:carbonic anhydrase/acetyltransferase-like protein (isoleucine patch superfamily)